MSVDRSFANYRLAWSTNAVVMKHIKLFNNLYVALGVRLDANHVADLWEEHALECRTQNDAHAFIHI